MNNQNTNGLNGINGESGVNTNPIGGPIPEVPNTNGAESGVSSTSVSPMPLEENQNGSTLHQTPVEPTPIKPTLDSILNGTPVMGAQKVGEENPAGGVTSSIPVEARPIIEEPVNSSVSHVSPVSDTPVVDNSANMVNASNDSVSSIQAAPVMPSIPSEPVMETIPEPVAPTIESIDNLSPVNQESVVMSPTPEILSTNTLNSAPVSTPVVENIEPMSTPEAVSESAILPVNATPEVNPNATQMVEQPTNIETLDNPVTTQDDFGSVPVPPVFDDGKKKEKKEKKERNKKDSKKTIIVLLIFVLIAAIGFGVYYFLAMAKESASKASIVLKDVKLELGSAMSSNIDDYATITGYDKANCTLDLTNVDLNKVSTYKYIVTCGKQTQEGTIIVDDTNPPKVTANDLVLLPNAVLDPESFIEKCIDASSCSYRFAEDYSSLTEKIGEYEVQIIVSDNFNNEVTVNAKLTVSRTAPMKYLTCVSEEETLEDIPATLVHSYRIGIDANDTFYNSVRTSMFTYTTLEDYNNAIRNYDQSVGISGIVGTETFNESEKSITLKVDKTLSDMNQDLNSKLPNNANIMKSFLSGLGYTCN